MHLIQRIAIVAGGSIIDEHYFTGIGVYHHHYGAMGAKEVFVETEALGGFCSSDKLAKISQA
jgi:hypothetical protein